MGEVQVQPHIGARCAPGSLILIVLLATALLVPSPAMAAPGPGATQPREVQRLLVRNGDRFSRAGRRSVRPADEGGVGRLPARPRPACPGRGGKSHAARAAARGSQSLAGRLDRRSGEARLGIPPAGRLPPRAAALQRHLERAGYDAGPVDGLFGPLTERAVTRFQRRHGLVVDGVVGRHTLRALGLRPALRRTQPAPPAAPAPAAKPPAPVAQTAHRHRSGDPVVLVIAGIVLLGLIAVLASYLRMVARIRRQRHELETRHLIEHAITAENPTNGHPMPVTPGKEGTYDDCCRSRTRRPAAARSCRAAAKASAGVDRGRTRSLAA